MAPATGGDGPWWRVHQVSDDTAQPDVLGAFEGEQWQVFIADLLQTPVAAHPGWFSFGAASDGGMDEREFVLSSLQGKQDIEESDPSAQVERSKAAMLGAGRVPWSTNVVGIVRDPSSDCALSISSRFSMRDGKPVPLWRDRFLAYLMDRVLRFSVLDLDFAQDPGRSWRQLLVLMLPAHLRRAMAKGVYRQYVRRDRNDSAPRGRIDVPRHLRENMPFMGTIAYATREYDTDNPVTELARHTVEYVSQSPLGRAALRRDRQASGFVDQLRAATPRYAPGDRSRVVHENTAHPVTHAFYHEYRDLQRLCLAILSGQGAAYTDHGRASLQGVLVDAAWLWEEYLDQLMAGHGIAHEHPRNKENSGATWLFQGNVGKIFPDFLLRHGDRDVVADAKYKPQHKVSGDDYQQVLAYMMRFDATTGLYLHPATGTQVTTRDLVLDSGWTREEHYERKPPIRVCKLGLPVDAHGFDDQRAYEQAMREREEELVRTIMAS